jgi:DNA helicase-2/ATP-dependent DNA helicase PcrA
MAKNNKKREATKAMKTAWLEQILSKFLLITFTDAAANEMRTRLAGAFLSEGYEIDIDKMPIVTFNAFAMEIVKKYAKELGYQKVPTVVDTNQTREAMGILPLVTRDKVDGLNYNVAVESQYGALTIAIKTFKLIKKSGIDLSEPGAAQKLIDEQLRPAGLYKHMSNQSVDMLIDLYQEYNDLLQANGLITFADQEPLMLKVLDMIPTELASYGFEHIVVDEFQDSSNMQMEFLRRLAATNPKDIMVIGDDNQSIYGFRDANPDNMIKFEEKMGLPVTSLYMTENYRSYEEIIEPANALVSLNVNKVDKTLVAAKGKGGSASVRGFYNEEDEQTYIVNTIKKLLEEGYEPEDIAVIAMTKKELGKISAALSKAGIDWVMMAPVKLIDNSRISAAISLADAFYDADATQSYFNYLVAKYDGKLLEELTDDEINEEINKMRSQFSNMDSLNLGMQQKIFHEYLEALNMEDELYVKWLEQVYENGDLVSELDFIQKFRRFGANTELKMDMKYKGVALTTAHSSKGLEWKVIINSISGYDSKILHNSRHQDEVEEKRRLLFVSMTRAKEKLFVTGQYVLYQNEFDGKVYNQFIKELYEIFDPSMKSYVPNDPMEAIRKEERRLARNAKAREKRAAAKAAAIDDENIDMTAKSRPMTKAEREEYDRLVRGAVQASLFD